MPTEALIVKWWNPLYGTMRMAWAKNASYKMMIAALLWNDPVRLLNVPAINDVELVMQVIKELWWNAYWIGWKTVHIDPVTKGHTISDEFGKVSRASMLFLWPLLAKHWKASIPMPGWDDLWKRPIDRTLDGLIALWAQRELHWERLEVTAPNWLRWTSYKFAKNSHTWTEVLLMAAALAEWTTIIENAALEPEIDDMIEFLNEMGARIRRRSFRTIEVKWVPHLWWAIHSVIPDRNNVVSYACATIISGWDVIIENANHRHLTSFLEKLQEAWWGYEIGKYGIRFYHKWPLKATDIETRQHPWFMTDWHALWAILMCTAHWTSIIHETVYPSRFRHYMSILGAMGGKFETFDPQVQHPEKVYNFNREPELHTWGHYAIRIHGPVQFTWGQHAIDDLRTWATAIIAWLVSSEPTILTNIEQIYRGYENIDEQMRSLGADIERVVL